MVFHASTNYCRDNEISCVTAQEENSFFPADNQQALEWIAVLSSMSVPFQIFHEHDNWIINVDESHFAEAEKHIKEYESERGYFSQLKYKAKIKSRTVFRKSYTTLLVAAGLIIFFRITGPVDNNSIWFRKGIVSADKINHEWWRLITGLTLHADIVHVLSNSLFLVIFASSLCFILGPGNAWLFILLAAVFGNFSTILIYRPLNHCSLGSSTAVFAALGLLGMSRTLSLIKTSPPKQALMPLLAVVIILGFTGIGDITIRNYTTGLELGRVDIMAHLMGFVWGLIFGVAAHFYQLHNYKSKTIWQLTTGLIALSIVVFCWYKALVCQ